MISSKLRSKDNVSKLNCVVFLQGSKELKLVNKIYFITILDYPQ